MPHEPQGATRDDAQRSPSQRLVSLDTYRGATMLLMSAEILAIPAVASLFAGSPFWEYVEVQFSHQTWVGSSLWDMIQPSFMFMVGVALPFSLASRIDKGQRFGRMLGHVLYRSTVLILLGIFLRSIGRQQTYFTFEDVLTQIGLGYTFLFLLAWTKPRTQAIVAVAILLAYWAAFAAYPLPGPSFDYEAVGVPSDWPHHLTGFAAHWDKNTNLAAGFDSWFLNLFPREQPLVFNEEGYFGLADLLLFHVRF